MVRGELRQPVDLAGRQRRRRRQGVARMQATGDEAQQFTGALPGTEHRERGEPEADDEDRQQAHHEEHALLSPPLVELAEPRDEP